MLDSFGRRISYIRVSVTDRCDLRCVYCMSERMTFLPRSEVLSLDELDRLCSAFVRLGVNKIRITGGEPLVRPQIISFFHELGRHLKSGALGELTLTTNGTQLARYASDLRAAGVRRVNVSVDSLDAGRFRAITRRGNLAQVLDGVAAASDAGLEVKINVVALKGVNDDEHSDMVAWCGARGFDLTFIEVMPLGEIEEDRADQYMPLSEVKARLAKDWTLIDDDYRTGGPARYVRVAETGRRIGFITPLTHNFCETCNRVRVTCTGTLYTCLGQDHSADLRPALRGGSGDEFLDAAIRRALLNKPRGHDFDIRRGHPNISVRRHMSVTGG
jgi:cyclic pyranopterin phosphate synthase